MPTNVRDPRTIITPDAFGIAPELLGMPLARPRQRLFAILIDLVVIGTLTAMFDEIQLFVWGMVGVFLIRVAFDRSSSRRKPTATILRFSAGCLGTMVLGGVVIAALAISVFDGDADDPIGASVTADLGTFSTGLDAVDAALREAADGAPGGEPPDDPSDEDPVAAAIVAEVEDMGDDEVLLEHARIVMEGAELEGEGELRAEALARRAGSILAEDDLEALDEQVEALSESLEDEVSRRQEAEQAAASTGNALVSLMRDIWEQLGAAIGLWSIYFTVVTTLWGGRTVGKRAMGVRIVRLDGEPMGWWPAFERAGGYIAGFATGLLGFAQIFWDPNRQCIHDKIMSTVVIDERAERVPGAWEEAWKGPTGETA